MSHNLATDSKTKEVMMMYAGAKPWTNLGQFVGENCVNWQEAMKQAHLDWEVIKQQLYGPPFINKEGKKIFRRIEAWGIFRKDTGRFLSTVGDQYTPIQNVTGGEIIDALLNATNGAHYETAGALGQGTVIWALARIPAADFAIGKGDQFQTYLLFTTSHDRSIAAQLKITTVRVVCNNTLNAALSGAGKFLRIRHTKNANVRLEQAKQMMSDTLVDVQSLEDKLRLLSERALTRQSATDIFDRLFPKPKNEEANDTKRQNRIGEILKLYEVNDNNAHPETRGTAYNLLNAITEFTDHHRSARVTDRDPNQTKEQARTESAMFGSGADFKENALEVIMLATAGASKPSKRITTKTIPITGGSILDSIIAEQQNR